MNNIMRQIGKKEEAFTYVWQQIKREVGQQFNRPYHLDMNEVQEQPYRKETRICFVCVKYGTKYGPDYVNKLYAGVNKNLTLEHSFACFTEDSNGLHENIKVIPLKEKNEDWSGWWSKVNIFDAENYREMIQND